MKVLRRTAGRRREDTGSETGGRASLPPVPGTRSAWPRMGLAALLRNPFLSVLEESRGADGFPNHQWNGYFSPCGSSSPNRGGKQDKKQPPRHEGPVFFAWWFFPGALCGRRRAWGAWKTPKKRLYLSPLRILRSSRAWPPSSAAISSSLNFRSYSPSSSARAAWAM